ncbi:MAG: GGDEF domain-containing protein [Eubacterium sp.]|nr:GGDEF domain-containing protein [Eubacterium sp.]
MNIQLITYIASNVLGIILFSLFLMHDLLAADRQEKQVKLDRSLLAFMSYFLCDSIWVLVRAGLFGPNTAVLIAVNFADLIAMTAVTYTWLEYVMAINQVPHRNRPINRFAVAFPFIVSLAVLIILLIAVPDVLIGDSFKLSRIFDVFLVCVPNIYNAATVIYTFRIAYNEKNPLERRKKLCIGLFPMVVVIFGLIQMVFLPRIPLFCYSSIVLMLIMFLQSLDSEILTDSLTGLNNRGRLMHYVSQPSNLRIENRTTYVVMMDINDFKKINDKYGHSEGDSALVIVSDALKKVVKTNSIPSFLGRYGGDEFVLIVYAENKAELESMLAQIKSRIAEECSKYDKPYVLTVGMGYAELTGDKDTFQKCLDRADDRLYMNKEYLKMNRTAV